MVKGALATSRRELKKAVHQSPQKSKERMLEHLFTLVFSGLVYPQIWEDPEVDMDALELGPDKRLKTIASGGCNIMSYLTRRPDEIIAVDLNRAHVALLNLKLTAAQHLPDYDAFFEFFGHADSKSNLVAYDRFIRPHLDPISRSYWDRRDLRRRRRIAMFKDNFYTYGALGHSIGLGHFVCRLYGVNPREILECNTLAEQQQFFDQRFAPLFDKKLIKWATSKKVSLYGLGIPPAQYDSLASAGGGDMSVVLRERLEKLACDFSMDDNYFAWQAFNRGYARSGEGPLPPYLKRENFEIIREGASRVSIKNMLYTDRLQSEDDASLDAYLLLDAQDWMTDEQLNAIWAEITRTAKPGARVVFRTADEPTLLPGRVADEILDQWTYEEEASCEYTKADRSSIYGGVHLYIRKG